MIVQQILLVSTISNVYRMVWKICILMLGCKELAIQPALNKCSWCGVNFNAVKAKTIQRNNQARDLPNQKVLDGDLLNVLECKQNIISSVTRTHSQM